MEIIVDKTSMENTQEQTQPGSLADRLVLEQTRNKTEHYPIHHYDYKLIDKEKKATAYYLDHPFTKGKAIGHVIALVRGRLYAVNIQEKFSQNSYRDCEYGSFSSDRIEVQKPYDQNPYWSEDKITSAAAYVMAVKFYGNNELANKHFKEFIPQCKFIHGSGADKHCFELLSESPEFKIDTIEKLLGTKAIADNQTLSKEKSFEAIAYRSVCKMLKPQDNEVLVIFTAIETLVPVAIMNVDSGNIINFVIIDIRNISGSANAQLLLNDDVGHRVLFHGIIVPLFDQLRAIANDKDLFFNTKNLDTLIRFLVVVSYCPFDFVPSLTFEINSSNEVNVYTTEIEMQSIGLRYSGHDKGYINEIHSVHPYAQLNSPDQDLLRHGNSRNRFEGRVMKSNRTALRDVELIDPQKEEVSLSAKEVWHGHRTNGVPYAQYWESIFRVIATTDIIFNRADVVARREKYIAMLDNGYKPFVPKDYMYSQIKPHYEH